MNVWTENAIHARLIGIMNELPADLTAVRSFWKYCHQADMNEVPFIVATDTGEIDAEWKSFRCVFLRDGTSAGWRS